VPSISPTMSVPDRSGPVDQPHERGVIPMAMQAANTTRGLVPGSRVRRIACSANATTIASPTTEQPCWGSVQCERPDDRQVVQVVEPKNARRPTPRVREAVPPGG
jgi:hypothetical protein